LQSQKYTADRCDNPGTQASGGEEFVLDSSTRTQFDARGAKQQIGNGSGNDVEQLICQVEIHVPEIAFDLFGEKEEVNENGNEIDPKIEKLLSLQFGFDALWRSSTHNNAIELKTRCGSDATTLRIIGSRLWT
jgi:hypothetical protein